MESRLSAGRAPVKTKPRALFDPKVFLAKIGEGRSLADYQKKQKVFSQGDPAEAVFYLQKGRIKLTVVSKQGKEAVIAILGPGEFFGEGCLAGQLVRMASAFTMSECSIMRLGKAAMVRVLNDEPTFSELFLRHLLSATFALKKIWWPNSSTQARSDWRGCCSCWPTLARSARPTQIGRAHV